MFSYTDSSFFRKLIGELPSFKKRITIIDSKDINSFTKDMDKKLSGIYKHEKKAHSLIDKIKSQLSALKESTQELQDSLIKITEIEKIVDDCNLGYGEQLSDSYLKMSDYIGHVKTQMSETLDLFSSNVFKTFNYQTQEFENFSSLVKKMMYFKEYVGSMKKGLSIVDKEYEEKNKDLDIFMAYLTHISHNNFKQLYIIKNRKINENLFGIMNKELSFLNQVG